MHPSPAERLTEPCSLRPEREGLLGFLAEHHALVVCRLAPDGTLRFLNPEGERLTGFAQGDLVGRCAWQILFPEGSERLVSQLACLEEAGWVQILDLPLVSKTGVSPRLDWFFEVEVRDGRPREVVGVGLDRNQQARARRQLEESDGMFRDLVEAAPDAILWMSGDLFLGCNQRTLEVFGCSQDEIVLRSPLAFSPPFQPDGRPSAVAAQELVQAALAGRRQSFEWEHLRRDGTPFMAEVTLTRTEVGGQALLQAIVRDVSERKRAEETLQASESRYRRLLENLGEGILHVDDRERILYANPAAEAIFGVEGGLAGRSLRAFLTDSEFARVMAQSRIRSVEGMSTYEVEICRPDGEVRTLEITGTPNWEGQERQRGTLGILRDVTDARRADASLRRLSAALAQASDGIFLAQASGQILYANPAMSGMSGLRPEDLLRQRPGQTEGGPWTSAQVDAIWEALGAGEAWRGRLSLRGQGREGRDYTVTLSPSLQAGGGLRDIVGTIQDVTREVELEAQLLHAQKMEALGVMAGGIAHDFNNLLMPILCYAEMARVKDFESARLLGFMDQIAQAAGRARDLVEHLLAFSRKRDQEAVPVRLASVLKECLKLVRAALPATITIRQDIEDGGQVLCKASQIHQVVMNLCTNAGHAMKAQGGELTVRLHPLHLDAPTPMLNGQIPAGDYLHLEVQDTGHGMDADTLARIFLPFFTTKAEEGTGLGLAIVHGIVTGLGGGLLVASQPGKGTVFTLYFPRLAQEAAPEPGAGFRRLGQGERILVVDDEEGIRGTLQEGLGSLGYRVTLAATGEEALLRLGADPGGFDLLLTDVTMPGMSGPELVARAHGIRPDLPTLMMSGNPQGLEGVLLKPVSMRTLNEALRRALG